MQDDTRNLTVADEHLKTALEEISLGAGQTEQSMIRAGAERAVRNMDLVLRRLQQEQSRSSRDAKGAAVDRAFNDSERAWQAIHDFLNTGDGSLHAIRATLEEAREAVAEARANATTPEALRVGSA
jgi:hypothetical protein